MESESQDFIDKTVLTTPRPTATSTVDKKSFQKKTMEHYQTPQKDSLEILCLSAVDLPDILEESRDNISTTLGGARHSLQEQRNQAENSLQRANNKVAGIPSKYLKPNFITPSKTFDMSKSMESTISESDLMRTPTDYSTPRNSVDFPIKRQSFSESVAHLSHKLRINDISMDNFVKDFQKAMRVNAMPKQDSVEFKPAEEAHSMLLADEMEWRKQNEMPVTDDVFSEVNSTGRTFMGEFFQQKSDTLSDILTAKSPRKGKPVPLIDISSVSCQSDKPEMTEKISPGDNSLSVSTIQKFLESEHTPKQIAHMLSEGNNVDVPRYVLEKKIQENTSVPVSQNTSYTSDHSENEAMKLILNKENIDILNTNKNSTARSMAIGSPSPTSSTSRSSSRALTSLPDGRLPIESTVIELIWGCVKIDKCLTQDFSVRNKTSKRLGLHISLSGHDFKIRKDNRMDTELLTSTKVILHPYESKVINISFIPTRVGAAIDELTFTPLDSKMQQTKKQCIRLIGYGGHERIEMHNLFQDTAGKYWMTLGKFGSQLQMSQTMLIKNTGVLASFVHMDFISKGLCQVTIQPNNFVVLPHQQKEVVVTHTLSSDSYKLFLNNSSSVFEMGTIHVVSGSEVNRGRLRRLCRKAIETGSNVDQISNILKEKFKDEAMPPDLVKFRESANALKTILGFFSRNEVIITIQRDPDQTLFPQYPDESILYQTLSESNSVTVLESTVVQQTCRLEPSIILLTPPSKTEDSLFLKSEVNRILHYDIHCEPKGLAIEPRTGPLNPSEEIQIKLKYSAIAQTSCYKLRVFVDDVVLETLVKIK